MRKVRYGLFSDFMPDAYDPCQPIGFHNIIRRQEEKAARTAKYYYYIVVNHYRIIIYDATKL